MPELRAAGVQERNADLYCSVKPPAIVRLQTELCILQQPGNHLICNCFIH